MQIRVLVDNITKNELKSEWGLAAFIEYGDHHILLDAGATGKFSSNAEAMGCDIGQVEYGVLSHAHYDHADGMGDFFAHNDRASFYLRKGAAENCYSRKWIFSKYIGIHRGFLETYQDRIVFVEGDYELLPGVTLIPHKTQGLARIGKQAGMYIKKDGAWQPDCFAHEQSLVFDTEKGLVICNSCSHGGAENIIREIAKTYPDKHIYALFGGFHLYASTEAQVRALAAGIRDTGIEKIYTGHCTGKKAFEILKEELGERAEQIYTGMVIEI